MSPPPALPPGRLCHSRCGVPAMPPRNHRPLGRPVERLVRYSNDHVRRGDDAAVRGAPAPAIDRAVLEPRPVGTGGWIRRLSPFLLAHRRNVIIAFGAAVAGQAVAAVTPVFEKVIIDGGIVAPDPPCLALARAPRAGRRLLVLLLVPPPLGRRPGQPRRAVRPAQRDLRAAATPRLRRPRPAPDRPARVAGIVRPRTDPGLALVPADHARQRGDAPALAGDHGDPVTATDTCDAGDAARPPASSR